MHWLSTLFMGIGSVVIVLLLVRVLQSTRRLNQKIAKHKAEVEEREKQGIPFNPYFELSLLYQEDAEPKPSFKQKKPKQPH